MRTWIAKFRISIALDSGKSLPRSCRSQAAASNELARFEAEALNLHRTLEQTAAETEPPPSFHANIMQAVRSVGFSPERRLRMAIPRWLTAPALATAVLLISWWASHSPRSNPPAVSEPEAQVLASAPSALALSEAMTQTAASAALQPLSEEWQRLNDDLKRTTDFLLASLP